ncbi:hypothetical protein CES85_3732 (plasmid) [Ochrobactrum quorumnocens]|uniref:Sel1 repeat family protein n=1 Tax=Ochrobactrum quorumnocens TaxID=271865 RepID=A0A248UN45_9HYPH|nr:sel1 repeat family protein [[Ochrobactrum] quorumnocens]ASV87821.1 hypothetical protein CES85_3732 [[Ochrobactrum] quorumnocens]
MISKFCIEYTLFKLIVRALSLMLIILQQASFAYAESLPPYQELGIRHICEATPVDTEPKQSTASTLKSGDEVRIKDLTFGTDNQPYFAIDYATGNGLQRAIGFVSIDKVSNFCNFAKRADSGDSFLAPPNTCHLIATKTETLAALNEEASALEKFRPSMAAYRMANGRYALSLGLLNIRANATILQRANTLPKDSECSTGFEFSEALVKEEKGFLEYEFPPFSSRVERLAAARALMIEAAQGTNGSGLKEACYQGLSEACSGYAETIYNAEDPHGTLPAAVTHFALLGCMGGNVLGCKLAINRAENTLENAQFRAVEGGTGNSADLVGLELAKIGCDARQAVSCILLARGTATYSTPTLIEAASNFAAKLTACKTGIGWACDELLDAFGQIVQARGEYASPTKDENYSLGALVEETCHPGPAKPDVVHCKPAYLKYRDFLQATKVATTDIVRVAKAKSLLERGCEIGDPSACAAQSKLDAHWPVEARSVAAARAIDLCEKQSQKDSVCNGLGASLDANLIGSQPAQRVVYDDLVTKCMTDQSVAGHQACSSAVAAYASLEGTEQTHKIEELLASACNQEKVNGCRALALLLAKKEQGNSMPIQLGIERSEALLAVLRTGCRFDDNPAGTCLLLAETLASDAKNQAALDVYAKTCDYLIAHASKKLDNVDICYEAAKFALAQKVRYYDALRWSDFACTSADLGLSPYACKVMGNIYFSGLGVDTNPQEAIIAYQAGCFHPFVSTTDGEACIKYGNMLLDAHEYLNRTGAAKYVLPENVYGDTQNLAMLLSEASRAYDMGCMDNIDQACQLNAKLLDEWSKGRFPHGRARCRVQDDFGQISSDKICRALSFYQAAGQQKEQRRQIKLEVYAWPDGDRTVVYQKDGTWLLNEVITAGIHRDGQSNCWRNPISKRSFCITPLGE